MGWAYVQAASKTGSFNVKVEAGPMREKGFLRTVRNDVLGLDASNPKKNFSVVEDESGDYLAFVDEADPIFLPREMMDWMAEREESQSFLGRLRRGLRKKV